MIVLELISIIVSWRANNNSGNGNMPSGQRGPADRRHRLGELWTVPGIRCLRLRWPKSTPAGQVPRDRFGAASEQSALLSWTRLLARLVLLAGVQMLTATGSQTALRRRHGPPLAADVRRRSKWPFVVSKQSSRSIAAGWNVSTGANKTGASRDDLLCCSGLVGGDGGTQSIDRTGAREPLACLAELGEGTKDEPSRALRLSSEPAALCGATSSIRPPETMDWMRLRHSPFLSLSLSHTHTHKPSSSGWRLMLSADGVLVRSCALRIGRQPPRRRCSCTEPLLVRPPLQMIKTTVSWPLSSAGQWRAQANARHDQWARLSDHHTLAGLATEPIN
jgi:hypothetical protein